MAKLKGNLLIGQSGGPTAVINASLAGVLRESKNHTEIHDVYGMVNGIEGALAENMLDLSNEGSNTIHLLQQTPGALLGSCRRKLKPEDHERLFKVLAAHDIRYFFYAGGNDSMDTCSKVRDAAIRLGYDLKVMGIPKTIDNDLAYTDHCPGFGTAARFTALTTRDAGLDLFALRTFLQVVVTEVMGRNAGWLAASSVLTKEYPEDPPHLIYLPERNFNEEKFLSDVQSTYKDFGYVSVVVSEGIHDAHREPIGNNANAPVDAFGHKVVALGQGCGPYLSDLVKTKLGLTSRCNRSGTIQRVSTAHYSSSDVKEAVMVGEKAVTQAVAGDDGYMVTLLRLPGSDYMCTTGLAKLADVANAEKFMPDEFINEDANFVMPSFREYAMPLLGDPIPERARFRNQFVQKIPK